MSTVYEDIEAEARADRGDWLEAHDYLDDRPTASDLAAEDDDEPSVECASCLSETPYDQQCGHRSVDLCMYCSAAGGCTECGMEIYHEGRDERPFPW